MQQTPSALIVLMLSMASMPEAAVLKHDLTSAEVNEHEIKDGTTTAAPAAPTVVIEGDAAQAAVLSQGIEQGDSVQEINNRAMGTVQSVTILADGKKNVVVHFDTGVEVLQRSNDFLKITKAKHLEAANAVQVERKKFASDAERAFKAKVDAGLKLTEANATLRVLKTPQTNADGTPIPNTTVGTAAQIAAAEANVTKQKDDLALYTAGEKKALENAKGELCDYRCIPNKHTWAEKCLWAKCDHSVCKSHCTAPAGWSAETTNTPRCEAVCSTSALGWTDKCSWKGCHGCQKGLTWDLGNCTAEVASATTCAGHCTRSTAAWADKCLWTKKCDACSECTASGGR